MGLWDVQSFLRLIHYVAKRPYIYMWLNVHRYMWLKKSICDFYPSICVAKTLCGYCPMSMYCVDIVHVLGGYCPCICVAIP